MGAWRVHGAERGRDGHSPQRLRNLTGASLRKVSLNHCGECSPILRENVHTFPGLCETGSQRRLVDNGRLSRGGGQLSQLCMGHAWGTREF